MSLRTFHLLFILVVIMSAELFGARELWHYQSTSDQWMFWMGILSLAGGLVLSVYALIFVRKMDSSGVY